MSEREEENGGMAQGEFDRALWRFCRDAEAPEDEAECLIDLAAFAEDRLDADEAERVAALLARDPAAAEDVAAARALAAAGPAPLAPDPVIARAVALVAPAGRVIRFAPAARRRPLLPQVAQWASLAAAIMLASWLGFAMGNDFSLDYSQTPPSVGDDGYLPELLDPSADGLLHSLAEDMQT